MRVCDVLPRHPPWRLLSVTGSAGVALSEGYKLMPGQWVSACSGRMGKAQGPAPASPESSQLPVAVLTTSHNWQSSEGE